MAALLRLLLLLLVTAVPIRAQTLPGAEVCEWAAAQAAKESGVPVEIMGALTLTETGRRLEGVLRPWAWSVNAAGEGTWFDDPASALTFARDRLAQGKTNFDIGCFQLNYRWHGANFASVEQMFDPLENARYAARFVAGLFAETGSWRQAAGAFHSRTPANAERYLSRFDTLYAQLRQDGFAGMTASPDSYNQFASIGSDSRSQVRERLMLLGAPPGTAVTGAPGSLAAIGPGRGTTLIVPRGPLLALRRTGPLFGEPEPAVARD